MIKHRGRIARRLLRLTEADRRLWNKFNPGSAAFNNDVAIVQQHGSITASFYQQLALDGDWLSQSAFRVL